MKPNDLFKNVELLGYALFKTGKHVDANKTLADVVKSKDTRLWEAFPLLLANSCERKTFDVKLAKKHLKKKKDAGNFKNLALMSLALYEYLKLEFSWAPNLRNSEFFDKKLFTQFAECFKKHSAFPKEMRELSSERVLNTFNRYFETEAGSLRGYAQMESEFDLEYSLSQVFSKKQKELFKKKLKGEKMTKTEREYYSRSVRKKVLALANTDLHALAVRLSRQ